jgi:hypothetical protein
LGAGLSVDESDMNTEEKEYEIYEDASIPYRRDYLEALSSKDLTQT